MTIKRDKGMDKIQEDSGAGDTITAEYVMKYVYGGEDAE